MEAIILHGIWATAAVIITYFASKTYQHKQECMVQKTNSEYLLLAHNPDTHMSDHDAAPARTPVNGTRLGT